MSALAPSNPARGSVSGSIIVADGSLAAQRTLRR